MRRTIKKLIIGKGQSPETPRQSTLHAGWSNVVSIWNNTIEKDASCGDLYPLRQVP